MDNVTTFFDLTGAVALSNSSTTMALTITPTSSGVRVKPSAQLLEAIGNPEKVEVLQLDGNVIILPARTETNALKVGKNRYLYDSALAKAIAKLAGVDFEAREATGESKSVQIGSYEIQPINENTYAAVISFDRFE